MKRKWRRGYRGGQKFRAPFILWIILFKMICWRHPNSDLNSQWKALSNTLYIRISSMDYEKKVSKKPKSVFFRSLKTLRKLFSDNAILKSAKILNKMRGRRVFYDLPLRIYRHHKTRKKRILSKNRWKSTKKCIFSCFVMSVTSQWKVVENATTPHFVQNFALFKMALSENNFRKVFRDLKNTLFSFLETLFP